MIEPHVNGELEVTGFTPFPKIPRLHGDIVVTEKLDGTNAAVVVTESGQVFAQSRTRFITPEADNYGFASWVAENSDGLRDGLGAGVHFGEWWGSGIQRGYGLEKGDKRFSLFNTGKWTCVFNDLQPLGDTHPELRDETTRCHECPECHVVPIVLRWGAFNVDLVQRAYDTLKTYGSMAAPGFENPEGVVVFHARGGHVYKLSDAKAPPAGH